MAEAHQPDDDHIQLSYRFLRLTPLVLILALFVSLSFEILAPDGEGWLGSISAYYYTPVHAVLIGGLLAIGASLIALEGHDGVENMFLNMAGVLAPVVALVPTDEDVCDTPAVEPCIEATDMVLRENADLVANNLLALGAGLVAVVLIAYFWGGIRHELSVHMTERPTRFGGATFLVMLVVGLVWSLGFPTSFEESAHGTSAAVMFIFIWCAVMINTGWFSGLTSRLYRRLDVDERTTYPYQSAYRWIAALMLLGAVIIAPIGLAGWGYAVFWLEGVEIALLFVFWIVQMLEERDRRLLDLGTEQTAIETA